MRTSFTLVLLCASAYAQQFEDIPAGVELLCNPEDPTECKVNPLLKDKRIPPVPSKPIMSELKYDQCKAEGRDDCEIWRAPLTGGFGGDIEI